MAWENYLWVWNVVGVQGSEYVVLILLANEANVMGLTPLVKVEKICRRCNLSRRSVFEYLKRLEQKGFIERKRKWAKAPFDANAFQLHKNRFFPRGEYNDAMKLWLEILATIPDGEIKIEDMRILKRVSEVFLQKNSRTLHLVTEVDLYDEVIKDNLSPLKKAGKMQKTPVRRFQAFRKPFLK